MTKICHAKKTFSLQTMTTTLPAENDQNIFSEIMMESSLAWLPLKKNERKTAFCIL